MIKESFLESGKKHFRWSMPREVASSLFQLGLCVFPLMATESVSPRKFPKRYGTSKGRITSNKLKCHSNGLVAFWIP